MHVKRLIFLLGWFEGPWRSVPVLQSRDVSRTSRWQSTRELLYLTDKDCSPPRRHLCIESFFAGFSEGTGGWKELSSSTIHWNLVAFNSKLASSIVQTRLCHLTKIALLCNLSARLPRPRGLSWEMEAFCELQKGIGNCVFPARHWVIALMVFLIH